MSERNLPIKQRLEDNIEIDSNGCWLWLKCKDRGGYGQIWFNGKRRLTHRISYELYVGPIPEGLQIDHLCRVRACCNPLHLEPVTSAENNRRGEPANRTHCPQGHEYSEENTYIYENTRNCRVCQRIRCLAHYHRKNK